MKMLPIMEMKKRQTFYCSAKNLFCKVAKCATKKNRMTECRTEKEVLLASQAGELASCM